MRFAGSTPAALARRKIVFIWFFEAASRGAMFRLALKSNNMGHTDTSAKAQTHMALIRGILFQGREVSALDIMKINGSMTARSRVADLKKEGLPIQKRMQPFTAASGHRGAYAVYFLPKEYLAGLHKE